MRGRIIRTAEGSGWEDLGQLYSVPLFLAPGKAAITLYTSPLPSSALGTAPPPLEGELSEGGARGERREDGSEDCARGEGAEEGRLDHFASRFGAGQPASRPTLQKVPSSWASHSSSSSSLSPGGGRRRFREALAAEGRGVIRPRARRALRERGAPRDGEGSERVGPRVVP